MMYDFTAFAQFAETVENDPILSEMMDRYDEDPTAFTDAELSEMVDRVAEIEDDDLDYPEDDYYEDWDALEMGFDPYMGCYSDDC